MDFDQRADWDLLQDATYGVLNSKRVEMDELQRGIGCLEKATTWYLKIFLGQSRDVRE